RSHHRRTLGSNRRDQGSHRSEGEVLKTESGRLRRAASAILALLHRLLLRPFRPLVRERRTLPGILSWIGFGTLISFVLIGILGPLLISVDQTKPLAYPILLSPSLQHVMGTDGIGRDVFARVIWGTRTSLEIMAIGALLALVVGFPLGLLSGFVGGKLDRLFVLVMD